MLSEQDFVDALTRIAQNCPRLVKACYWSGTSPVILEENLHWTDAALAADLKAYPGVNWQRAASARDLLLGWWPK